MTKLATSYNQDVESVSLHLRSSHNQLNVIQLRANTYTILHIRPLLQGAYEVYTHTYTCMCIVQCACMCMQHILCVYVHVHTHCELALVVILNRFPMLEWLEWLQWR